MNIHIQDELTKFRNERGVIAERYSQLQALHILDEAREKYPLPQGSDGSTLRAIFQSMEIALLNVADLVSGATNEIRYGRFGAAMVKISWARGFHRVMVRLSMMPNQLGLIPGKANENSELSISDSPAYKAYFEAIRLLDKEILDCINIDTLSADMLLAQQSLDNNQLSLIHLIRICNHETSIWENNLARVLVPCTVSGYEEFVATHYMRRAVYDTTLEGETYYMQFRGLHQIPELLCAEVNNHVEISILQIRSKTLQKSLEHLRYVNILFEGILASASPMVDNLTTADYHNIRENLGLTSGNHSVSLHYHLFRDLYDQLWNEFKKYLLQEAGQENSEQNVQEVIRQADLRRFEDYNAFLVHLLANALLELREYICEWRNAHLHLARNNVGGSYTKSLTGSPDAVEAVKKMRESSLVKDPMQPLVEARGLRNPAKKKDVDTTPLTDYFGTDASLDKELLEITGKITKERFKDVQERTGVFAKKSPFVPPPKHEV